MDNPNHSGVGPGSLAPGDRAVERALGRVKPGFGNPRVSYVPPFTLGMGRCSWFFRE